MDPATKAWAGHRAALAYSTEGDVRERALHPAAIEGEGAVAVRSDVGRVTVA